MMQTTADVVVIGAGVIGCSTAYHLARMGTKEVVVVEKGALILNHSRAVLASDL